MVGKSCHWVWGKDIEDETSLSGEAVDKNRLIEISNRILRLKPYHPDFNPMEDICRHGGESESRLYNHEVVLESIHDSLYVKAQILLNRFRDLSKLQ